MSEKKSLWVRRLGLGDEAALEAFLKPRTAQAYYLRSNALTGGLGPFHGKILQADYVATLDESGAILACAAYTWLDTLLVCGAPAALAALAPDLKACIGARGGHLEAILGLAEEADALIDALGLTDENFRSKKPDWLYLLKIEELNAPPAPQGFRLRAAEQRDREILIQWRIAFNIEATRATPGPELTARVTSEIDRRLRDDQDLVVLENDAGLVSFCGVGGHIPEAVIVGPVWTPREERRKGYAKIVTGGAIALVAQERPALREAILFASEPDAIRVYTTLGFEKIGDWRLGLLKESFRLI